MISLKRDTDTSQEHMWRLARILGGMCVLLFILVPHTARAEFIESFNVDINIESSSVVTVTEKITYFFSEPKHGIFRCIPTIHHDPASSLIKERYIDVELTRIRMDGAVIPYTTEKSRGEVCVKIGNPDATIIDKHIYEIVYTVGGGIAYPAFGGAEFYWNVTGNAWEVPIKSVETRVTAPDILLQQERACYLGEIGKEGSCSMQSEGNVSVFRGGPLRAYEGLTIAQAIDRSKIPHDVRERYKLSTLLIIFIPIILALGGLSVYRYKTKFRTKRTIIPQYEPYPGVKPMYAGFLFDKRLDNRDITAGIVYLAEQGYIKIKRTEKKVFFFFEVDDYEMTLLKPISDLEHHFEKTILRILFKETAAAGEMVTLSGLKKDYTEATKRAELLRTLGKSLEDDLEHQQYFNAFHFSKTHLLYLLVGSALVIGTLLVFSRSLLIPFIITVIGLGIYGLLMQGRRTKKGYEALDHLKGFKQFLSVTETQRYIFHNAPERNAEQFMAYLPYAIAFGVEKEWAKVFEGVTIQNPGWYEGGTASPSFNATSLTNSLGGFSTAFASTTTSGSGASSGGGFSGGGSGGGGGGSW